MLLHEASWKLVEHANGGTGTGETTVEELVNTFCHGD